MNVNEDIGISSNRLDYWSATRQMIKIGGKWKSIYRYQAEQVLGKSLPEKAQVHHHLNGDLVICEDASYHAMLHVRERAYEACGHADWRKCCICKKYDDPANLRIVPGSSVHHRDCMNKVSRQWSRKKKELERARKRQPDFHGKIVRRPVTRVEPK